MDTVNPIEGNPVGDGADAAKQSVSKPVSQPSAEDFAALNKRLAELESQNRSLQSGKDKRWNEVMPVIKRVAERLGIDEAKVLQAQREEVLDSLIAERLAPASSGATPGTGQPQAASVEVSSIVSEYGLDLNNPTVAAFVRDNKYADKDQAELAVARLEKRLRNQPSPSLEQNPVSSGGKPPVKDAEALTREYIEKVKANAGKRDAIKALQAEYAQRGVAVDKIVWTR